MTVPVERTNAVMWTEDFLLSLLDPKQTPRVPKIIRTEARRLLRHYPSKYEMGVIADREDGVPDLIRPKIFGKGFQ
jgi:hypothetical protein